MILKLKFISDEVDGFLREIEADGDATFLDLCKALLASCGYPDDQMTSFTLCDDEWEPRMHVTREDMGAGASDVDCYVMAETRLSEFLDDEDAHLTFAFDPFNDRKFYGTVVEVRSGSKKKVAIVRQRGEAPRQIAELDFSMPNVKAQKGTSFDDDDLYGISGGFNEDELDLEGFEISDGIGF